MIGAVVVVSLALAVANWLLFAAAAVVGNLPRIREALRRRAPPHAEAGIVRHDVEKTITATGGLATAFRSAGPSAAAAALSLACLLVAAAAAGIGKL